MIKVQIFTYHKKSDEVKMNQLNKNESGKAKLGIELVSNIM